MGWGEFIGNSLAAYRSTKKRLEMEDQCLNIKDYCSPEAQHNVAEILLDSCLPGSDHFTKMLYVELVFFWIEMTNSVRFYKSNPRKILKRHLRFCVEEY